MTTAYLIDPFARTVERVELVSERSTEDELHEIYALLGCSTIEAVHPYEAGGDVIFLDEEGKINGRIDQAYFFCRLWPHDALAGKALWVGVAAGGDITDPASELDYARDHIVWPIPI